MPPFQATSSPPCPSSSTAIPSRRGHPVHRVAIPAMPGALNSPSCAQSVGQIRQRRVVGEVQLARRVGPRRQHRVDPAALVQLGPPAEDHGVGGQRRLHPGLRPRSATVATAELSSPPDRSAPKGTSSGIRAVTAASKSSAKRSAAAAPAIPIAASSGSSVQ